MKPSTFTKRVIAANARCCRWYEKVERWYAYSPAQQQRNEEGARKADEALASLVQSVTEEVFNASDAGSELCSNWQDWQ